MAFTPQDYFRQKAEKERLRQETISKRQAEKEKQKKRAYELGNESYKKYVQQEENKGKVFTPAVADSIINKGKEQSIQIPADKKVKYYAGGGVEDPVEGKSYVTKLSQKEVEQREMDRFRSMTVQKRLEKERLDKEQKVKKAQELARENLRPKDMTVAEYRVATGTATPKEYQAYRQSQAGNLFSERMTPSRPTPFTRLGLITDEEKVNIRKYAQERKERQRILGLRSVLTKEEYSKTTEDKSNYTVVPDKALKKTPSRIGIWEGDFSNKPKSTLSDEDIKTGKKPLVSFGTGFMGAPEFSLSGIFSSGSGALTELFYGKDELTSRQKEVRQKGLYYVKKREFEQKEMQIYKGTYKEDWLDKWIIGTGSLFGGEKQKKFSQQTSLGIRKGVGLFVAKEPESFIFLPAMGYGVASAGVKLASTGKLGAGVVKYGGLLFTGMYGAGLVKGYSKAENSYVGKLSYVSGEALKFGEFSFGAMSGAYTSRPKSAEVVVTKIETTPRTVQRGNVKDILNVEGKIRVGQGQWKTFSGTGEQFFKRLSSNKRLYNVRATTKVKLGVLESNLQSRGFSVLGKTGAKTIVVTNKQDISFLTTKKEATKPLEFRQDIVSGSVKKAKTLRDFNIRQSGAGKTKEFSLDDIFTGKKMVFRKDIRVESTSKDVFKIDVRFDENLKPRMFVKDITPKGKSIGRQYLLETKSAVTNRLGGRSKDMSDFLGKGDLPKFDMGKKDLPKFEIPSQPRPPKLDKLRYRYFGNKGMAVEQGGETLFKVVRAKPKPAQKPVDFNLPKDYGKQAMFLKASTTQKINSATVRKVLPQIDQSSIVRGAEDLAFKSELFKLGKESTFFGTGSLLMPKSFSGFMPKVSGRSRYMPNFKPTGGFKPVIEPTIKPTVDFKPLAMPVLLPENEPIIKPTVKPTFKPIYEPVVQPVVQPVIKPTYKPSFTPSYAPKTITPIAPPPVISGLLPMFKGKSSDTSTKKPGKKAYRPSLRGALFKLKQGKRPKTGLTGFEIRGL